MLLQKGSVVEAVQIFYAGTELFAPQIAEIDEVDHLLGVFNYCIFGFGVIRYGQQFGYLLFGFVDGCLMLSLFQQCVQLLDGLLPLLCILIA